MHLNDLIKALENLKPYPKQEQKDEFWDQSYTGSFISGSFSWGSTIDTEKWAELSAEERQRRETR